MGLLSRKVTTPYIKPHRTEPEWFRVNPPTACACIPPLLLWVAGAGHKDHPRCCPFMDEVVTYPQVQIYLQSISLDSCSGAYLPSLQPGQTFMAQTDTLGSVLIRIRAKKIKEPFWYLKCTTCFTQGRNMGTCNPGLVTKLPTHFDITCHLCLASTVGHDTRKRRKDKILRHPLGLRGRAL